MLQQPLLRKKQKKRVWMSHNYLDYISSMGNTTSTNYRSHLSFNIIDDKSRAKHLLNYAEATDHYIETCHKNKSNYMARRQLTYSVNTVSIETVIAIQESLDRAMLLLPPRLLSDLYAVHLVQLMPSADGGMPHTRPGNIICYPNTTTLLQTSTLIHELWHIHQRNFKELWTDVFLRLKWKPWSGDLPIHLAIHKRFNPDTIDSPLWIYQDTWIPIPIFRDITNPKVNEVDIWFYHVGLQYHVKRIPPELEKIYPNLPASAYEHPRELTAYMLAEPDKHSMSPAFKDLISLIGKISLPL